MAQDKFYFDNPTSPLIGYPADKIMEIYEDYLDLRIIVKDTEKKYNLDPPMRKFLPLILTDEECRQCNHKVYTKPSRLSAKPRRSGINSYIPSYCTSCKHEEGINTCYCIGCEEERQEKERLKLERVERSRELRKKQWEEAYKEVYSLGYTFDDLCIYDKIYLCVLFDHLYYDKEISALSFSTSYIKANNRSYEEREKVLNRMLKIARRLVQSKFLIPSKDMGIGKNSNGQLLLPNIGNGGDWIVNLVDSNGQLLSMEEIHHTLQKQEYLYKDKLNLMKVVYGQELRSKMNVEVLKYFNLNFDKELALHYAEFLFPKYSLAEAFQLAFYVVNNGLRFSVAHQPSTKAMRTFFKNEIHRLIERFEDPQEINTRERDWSLYLDPFSEYVLGNVLGVKESYFNLSIEKLLPPQTIEEENILESFISFNSDFDSIKEN